MRSICNKRFREYYDMKHEEENHLESQLLHVLITILHWILRLTKKSKTIFKLYLKTISN